VTCINDLFIARLKRHVFRNYPFSGIIALVFCLSGSPKAVGAESARAKPSGRQIAVVYAYDGHAVQPSINFYRAVFTSVSQSPTWDVIPIDKIRKSSPTSESKLGGIPVVDREEFRKALPKRIPKSRAGDVKAGASVPDLQRLLDNLAAPAAIVVDCLAASTTTIKACGLYYYDRVSARVVASSVKSFASGVNDAAVWASPMLLTLDEGLAASRRAKNQAIIEELVARNEEDEDAAKQGVIGVSGRSSKAALESGWSQSLVGFSLQLGFMAKEKGVLLEGSQLKWRGTGLVTTADKTTYGINMFFRAKALEALIWIGELGAGREIDSLQGAHPGATMTVTGMYVTVRPSVGIELAEYFTLDLGLHFDWFFEASTARDGSHFAEENYRSSRTPGVALRGQLIL
jgi:hypothetical protein